MKNLELTRDLRYQIQMCKSQSELDTVIKHNRRAIHEHSYMRFVVENTRRVIRHIETARDICQLYLQN